MITPLTRENLVSTELSEQIKAAQDAGAIGWLLWDPRNRYPADVLADLARELKWNAYKWISEIKP